MPGFSMSPRRSVLAILTCLTMSAAVAWSNRAPPAHAAPGVADAGSSPAAIATAADDIVRVAGDHRVLLIGELHGTREMPQLAAALVDRYSRTQPVLLALELGRDGHAALATYLNAQGNAADLQVLRDQPFLHAPDRHNDGRRNEAVLDLVEALRQSRVSGRDVAILPFDVAVSGDGAESRDRQMAAYLRKAYAALPRGRLIVVTGNVHAMKARPDFPDAAKFQTPLGARLRDLAPYSFNVGARAGYYRACAPQCRQQPAFTFAETSGPASGPFRDSNDYQIVLPAFSTASLIQQTPAR